MRSELFHNQDVKHLEECHGCAECDDLLQWYMACDGCGSWGSKESDGFELVFVDKVIPQFLCKSCAAHEGKEGENDA